MALINTVVGRFKSYTTHLWQKQLGGSGVLWQEGFHDWLCMSREMIDSVERYIAYNALKWWLRNGGGRALMALHEPLRSSRLGQSEFWRGVGAVELLNEERGMVSLRVSRRCDARAVADIVARRQPSRRPRALAELSAQSARDHRPEKGPLCGAVLFAFFARVDSKKSFPTRAEFMI